MIENIKELNLEDYTEAIPAFLTIIMMPFAYSIADGIAFGVLSYIGIKAFSGKIKEKNVDETFNKKPKLKERRDKRKLLVQKIKDLIELFTW